MSGNTSIAFDILAKDRASKTFSSLGGGADSAAGKIGKLGKIGATAFAGLAVAGTAFLVKVGAPYVDSLNKIQALGDLTAAQTNKVAKSLEASSGSFAKMGQTTGDAAAGMVELVKAGLDVNQSLKAVTATMTLAKAGELSVADASSLVANTLNTFHMKASQAGDIANYLANAANISSADVTDLAEAFKYVAPVAAATGVSLKQTNAILAELSNSGISASNAGTGFRKFLLSLQAPSGAAAKDLKKLGVTIFDSKGKMKPLADVIDQLGGKLKGLSDQQRQKNLKDIFGLQGVSSAQVIFDNGAKGLAKYTAGVGKAGAAQKLAESASKGLMGTIKAGQAQLVSFGQSAYRILSPLANEALKPLVDGFSKFSTAALPAMQAFVEKGPGKLKAALSGLGGSGMAQQLAKTGKSLAAFGAQMLPTLKHLGSELMATLGPGLKEIGGVIQTQLLPSFRKILPVIAPVAKVLLKIFGESLIGVLSGSIKVIKGLLTTISGVFNLIADLVHGKWGKVWGDLGQIVRGALGAVLGAIQVWWNMGVLSLFRRGFVFLTKGIWVKGFEALKGGAEAGLKALERLFKSGLSALGRGLMAAVRGYIGLWKGYFTLVRTVVTTGWRVLRSAFGGAIASIRTMISTFLGGIARGFTSALSTAKNAVVRGMGAVVRSTAAGLTRVIQFYVKLPGRILSALGNLGTMLYDAGVQIIAGLIKGIGDKAKELPGILKDKVTSVIPGKVKHLLGINSPAKVMIPIGAGVVEGLNVGMKNEAKRIPTVTELITKAIAKGLIKGSTKIESALDHVRNLIERDTSRLSALKDKRAEYLSTFSSTGPFGADLSQGGGLQAMIDAARSSRFQAVTQKSDINKLIGLGLSKSLLAQLRDSGDYQSIHTLASASKTQIALLNSLNTQTTRANQAAGLRLGNAIHGTNIDAQISQAQRELRFEKAVERAIAKMKIEVHTHLEGKDIVYSVKAYNRARGQKTAGI